MAQTTTRFAPSDAADTHIMMLDTTRAFVYNAGLFGRAAAAAAAVFVATVCFGMGHAAAAESASGVAMPKKATAEGPNRFLLPGTLKDAVKFFKKRFKRSPHVFLDAIEHPKAKVVHIQSRDSSTAWSGINISHYGGKVHVFVIPRDGRSKTSEPAESTSE